VPQCAGQWAIQTALGGYQSINDLVAEGGRLRRQRDLAYELITAIPGVSCVKPSAALYMFPRLDPAIYPIRDDQAFILELLQETKVMLVQGTGFNWDAPDHFRIVFLPHEDDLREAIGRIARFLELYRKRHWTIARARATGSRQAGRQPGLTAGPQFPFHSSPTKKSSRMNPIQVGLLGIGTVGSGTFSVLKRNQAEIRRRAGRGIEITMVADLDVARAQVTGRRRRQGRQ
jgi:hypothetical protein